MFYCHFWDLICSTLGTSRTGRSRIYIFSSDTVFFFFYEYETNLFMISDSNGTYLCIYIYLKNSFKNFEPKTSLLPPFCPSLLFLLSRSSFQQTRKFIKLQMEGLSVADANLVMYLHPSKSRNVSQSILRELGSLLFKFNETFDGVLLAYDVNILDKQAKILSGVHPYFGLRLKANLLLFSPKPDMLLEGKVVKLSQESIHVIVLGFSSAIITAENIRGEFKYLTKDKEELFASKSHKRHVIKVGTMIRFLVKSFDEEILHIIGSLISAHTGSIRWLDRHLEEDSEFDRSSMKSRDREWLGDRTVDEGATPMSYDNHIKMSKKRRITE
ncbi:hypothetical protein ES288_A09G016400v1 [Gossypium darwinii]|uniref:DNA-directed RNA polymerase subunit n=1 Tax=Gossypium darwinii TaxID=34276 RepID=A0A5D2F585_GOSDA|nr:hypothetical protein ES288_A09G016400v1 [Gossypium darwinii]